MDAQQTPVDPTSGYRGGLKIAGWELYYKGKVRDLYRWTDDPQHILMVATDRLSAFDVVMNQTVPDRGKILTHITEYWLQQVSGIIGAARITLEPEQIPHLPSQVHDALRGRCTWTRLADRVNVEIVLRAYLAGSGYREYQANGRLWDHELPTGLQKSSKLPAVLHTPTTKDEVDLPISWAQAVELIGDPDQAQRIKEVASQLFDQAAQRCASAGVLLADTKFEFGRIDGELVLIDEVLTPDSSRYWPSDQVRVGHEPPSYDKEIVRAYLRSLSSWDRTPPPPEIPAEIIARTRSQYLEICRILTGSLPSGVQN
jgi:phosphoribosylaminoimidazole-succinocarboxamide synthase